MTATTVVGAPTVRSQALLTLMSAPGTAPRKPSIPSPVFWSPQSLPKRGSLGIASVVAYPSRSARTTAGSASSSRIASRGVCPPSGSTRGTGAQQSPRERESAPPEALAKNRHTLVSDFCAPARARIKLVARRPLDRLALGRVGAALLVERLAGFGDVVGEAIDLGAAERLLDQRPHHLHLLGVGRHRVGGQHPATLRRAPPG